MTAVITSTVFSSIKHENASNSGRDLIKTKSQVYRKTVYTRASRANTATILDDKFRIQVLICKLSFTIND